MINTRTDEEYKRKLSIKLINYTNELYQHLLTQYVIVKELEVYLDYLVSNYRNHLSEAKIKVQNDNVLLPINRFEIEFDGGNGVLTLTRYINDKKETIMSLYAIIDKKGKLVLYEYNTDTSTITKEFYYTPSEAKFMIERQVNTFLKRTRSDYNG